MEDKMKKNTISKKTSPSRKGTKQKVLPIYILMILVVVLTFLVLGIFKEKLFQNGNHKEVSGEGFILDSEFEVNAYPELNKLIENYFSAYANADFKTLETCVTPLTETEKSYITMMSQFYEKFQNITCYSKHGLSKNSYIVSACVDIKYNEGNTFSPNMFHFYVQTDKNGQLYINNLYSDFNLKYKELAIDKDVLIALQKYASQNDYTELFDTVETKYINLIKVNNSIYQVTKRLIPGTVQLWEKAISNANIGENEEDITEDEILVFETPFTNPTETQATNEISSPVSKYQIVKVKSSGSINVRSGAGTSFDVVGKASNGDIFVKLETEKGSDGHEWTKIRYTDSIVGYIRSNFLIAVTE